MEIPTAQQPAADAGAQAGGVALLLQLGQPGAEVLEALGDQILKVALDILTPPGAPS